MTQSIKEFGLVDPIIANSAPERRNIVIGGHFRLKIAQDLGHEDVPVVYVNIPDLKKEQELNIRLNKNLGEWDYDLLANFDESILEEAGFSSEELEDIFDLEVAEDEFDAEAEAAKITKPVTQSGDLYILGQHRLLCGDSTKREDVDRLMAGKKADMIFTDPPYNVDYNYDVKYVKIHKARKKRFLDQGKIFNDKKSPEEFYQFLLAVFKNCFDVSADAASLYVCHATKTQEQFFKAYKDAGWHFSQTIIWLKERIILALGQDYHRVYEPIIFGWKEGKKHYKNKLISTEKEVWDLDKLDFEERLDVWYLHRDKSIDYIHPTQKPVRLPERAIRKNCQQGGILFEPFLGSGSTMIACEQLKRVCYGVELDPRYCDVIVKRWESFTGETAKKL